MNEQTTSPDAPLIQVRFTGRRAPLQSLGGGLYRRDEGKTVTFWERPKIGGVRTIRKLDARTERAARLELAKKRSDQALARRGLAADPYARVAHKLTIAELADDYLAAGCPKRKGQPRTGKQLAEEKRRVAYLVEHLGRKPWDTLAVEDLTRYRKTRAETRTRKNCSGDRAIDLELVTLSAIFRWAVMNKSRTGVDKHPIAHRIVFHDEEKVRHCRDTMPASGDELHQLASYLFHDPKSQVLGWQMLFEAFIGHRTQEILRLRWDARCSKEPGFIEPNEKGAPKTLYLFQSDGHKGAYGHIDVHPALRAALEALADWRAERYPNSPWYFPSPYNDQKPVDKSSLTKALRRACRILHLPQRTSHGMRSFYVNVLRSSRDPEGNPKIPDAEIALRIGQKTGGREIVDVYGKILPYKLTWLPKKKEDAAWNSFKHGRPVQLELSL